MPYSNMHNLCGKYHGKTVRIKCRDGKVHVGEITRVTNEHVWLRPSHHGGFGYGLFGGYGYGGYGYPVALGIIVGITLASAFFW